MGVIYSILISSSIAIGLLASVSYDTIETAFENGDAEKIVSMGKDKILINVEGKEGAYGHSQAVLVLKDFFTKNPPAKFAFTFKGKESTEGTFAIGTYTSKNGSHRVTIHFKKNGNELSIESLSIEKA